MISAVGLFRASGPLVDSGLLGAVDSGEDEGGMQASRALLTGATVVCSTAHTGSLLRLLGAFARRSLAASRNTSSGSSSQNVVAFGPCTPRMLLFADTRRCGTAEPATARANSCTPLKGNLLILTVPDASRKLSLRSSANEGGELRSELYDNLSPVSTFGARSRVFAVRGAVKAAFKL